MNLMALANPGMRGLLVRKTLASLGSTALVTWREKVIPEALKANLVVFYGGSAAEPAQYRYENGSTIVIGGMDKVTKIMSSEYDVIYVQEATELTETDWESLTTRLRNNRISFQQLLADCNPSTPTHWLKMRADSGRVTMLESRHTDNPLLYYGTGQPTAFGTEYLSKLDALTGVRLQRLRYGKWVAAEGIIYEDYDPAIHVVDRFPIPHDWTRIWSVDFGFTNPFVCQCWAQDPDGRLFLEWELYQTKGLVEDHARTILNHVTLDRDSDTEKPQNQWTVPRPRVLLCDHDAEDRATLERHLGITTTAASKTVSDGIQAVASRFRNAGDGRPRIHLLRDAVLRRDHALVDAAKPACTQDEIPGYIWSDTLKKEQPVKENDHGCDAMRYVVAYLDLRNKTNIRWL
jgi:phage terminase large subunit